MIAIRTFIIIKRNKSENVSEFECPKCKSIMYQLISSFRFNFKGSGWFKDGYSVPQQTKQNEKTN